MADIPRMTDVDLLLNEAEYQRLLSYGKQIVESGDSLDPFKSYDPPGEAGLNPDASQLHQSSPFGSAKSQFIGPHKLLQKQGEGGMGEVWIAEQTEPVKRRLR